MKASLKFREEQRKPLFKAKIPLNVIGFPFQSSLAAGNTKELCLSLGSSFETGPAIRIAYRPNDPSNPFSLLVKTGIGHLGSPIDAPMTMSAEFNFPGGNSISNPRFFLHFKPQFGNFSLKKSTTSSIKVFPGEDGNGNGGFFGGGEDEVEVIEKPPVGEFYSGVILPILNGTVLKFRWGMKLPGGLENWFANPRVRMWPRGIPQLRLNKIGIEHVAREDRRKEEPVAVGPPQQLGGNADVAEVCFGMKRQLEMVRAENALLGQALEDLRAEFGNAKRGRGRGESEGNNAGIEDTKKSLNELQQGPKVNLESMV